MEYWLATKIHDINNNTKVKIIIIFKSEFESAWGLLVYLAVMAVFYKMLNCLNFNLMACLLENPKQSVN